MILVRGEQCITAIQFVVWWVANSLYAIDVQNVLRRFGGAPLMFIDLALVQIVVGIVMALGIQHLLASRKNEVGNDSTRNSHSIQRKNLAIGCLHISAVMLTNFSYRTIGSTSTLVWKLSEPFAAVVLKYLILKEGTELLSLAGVTLTVMGVLTYSVNSMSMFAATPVVLANILFPTRNVVVKLSQKNGDSQASTAQRYSAFLFFSLPFAVCMWAVKIIFEPTQFEAFPLLLRNAFVFNLYQLASISLLEKLDALTHSLANTMKRFLGILLSAILLKEHFTRRHLTGLVMTAIGFCLYIQRGSRHKSTASSKPALKVALFGTLLLLLYGIMAQWRLRGSEFAFNRMKEPATKSLVSESLISAPEHGTHRAYLDSLKGVRSDLYIIPRAPQNMSKYSVDENDIWSYTGGNLGNLVWGRGAFEMLADFSCATKCESLFLSDCLNNFNENERFSSYLFFWPVANVFHEDQLCGGKFIVQHLKMGHEMLMIGAGLQSSFDDNARQINSHRQDMIKNFHPKETLEFLGEMERRSQTIMVRGDSTLLSLKHAGFTHGISAGCPSLFLNKEVHLGRLLEGKYEALRSRIGDTTLKIGINIAQPQQFFFQVLLKIYKKYPRSVFFAQGQGDLIALKKANVPTSRVRLFSNVDEWKAELQRMDVVLGGRIHGSMLGLGSSVPVFVIAPDYRVLELVERMMIPHTTVFDERLRHDFDVAELVYNERMNATRFDTNRCEIAKLYRSSFERHGFGVSEHLWQISNTC